MSKMKVYYTFSSYAEMREYLTQAHIDEAMEGTSIDYIKINSEEKNSFCFYSEEDRVLFEKRMEEMRDF